MATTNQIGCIEARPENTYKTIPACTYCQPIICVFLWVSDNFPSFWWIVVVVRRFTWDRDTCVVSSSSSSLFALLFIICYSCSVGVVIIVRMGERLTDLWMWCAVNRMNWTQTPLLAKCVSSHCIKRTFNRYYFIFGQCNQKSCGVYMIFIYMYKMLHEIDQSKLHTLHNNVIM